MVKLGMLAIPLVREAEKTKLRLRSVQFSVFSFQLRHSNAECEVPMSSLNTEHCEAEHCEAEH
jgi:hypothetical protein